MNIKEWFQKHSFFMNEVGFLAQIGHVLAGNLLVLTTAFFCGSHHWILLLTGGAFVLYAGLKEFWFDANYEIPKQTNFDNWLDFSMYMLGFSVGCAEVLLKWFL